MPVAFLRCRMGTYAAGPSAEAFNGTIDNTELIGLVADAMGTTLEAPSMP